jgi:cell wall-associated NlpC family hydrolase
MKADYACLIGVPYKELDCFGVVQKFYDICFGIDLGINYSGLPEEAKILEMVEASKGRFIEIGEEEPIFGDLILIKIKGIERHIAVYLGNDKMLHSLANTGSCIEPIYKWRNMVSGIYRVRL